MLNPEIAKAVDALERYQTEEKVYRAYLQHSTI